MKAVSIVLACGWFVCLLGCGEEAPAPAQKPASIMDYAPAAPVGGAVAPANPATPPPPVTEQVKAEVGVGKKGRGYGGGIITEPVHQYFVIKERLPFEIEIPHALELYKAEHNGKGPKTQEAFMRDIIEFNSIKLPELPEGHKYIYDPDKAELMVERPSDGNQTEESNK